MSSVSLTPITANLPLDRRSRRRLENLVRKAQAEKHLLTFEMILRRVDSIPPELLSMILARLVDLGLAERIIRVESPATKVGLGDFLSLDQVPRTIHDHSTGSELTVTPDDLRVIYKF
jgi:hypothetical protein